ncbi:MAG: signal peptidase I [Ruminococcus sp.]|nr:signal peptidase I [Ruminococcus sp.]
MSDKIVELPSSEVVKAELDRARSRSTFLKLLYNTVASLIVVAAISVLISMLFLPVLRVTGTSMTPTLENDQLVVCRRMGGFERGDIIAFYHNNKILLKRVIGLAGDTVDIALDGTVSVNGEKLDEPYVDALAYGTCNIKLPYQVPENRVFVMGDHRSDSIDSRTKEIGCIAEEMVVGKVIWCIWPFGSIKAY